MTDQPDLFSSPALKRRAKKLWCDQPYESRAKKIEAIAREVDGYRAQDAEFLREHADHLRALAKRMRDERRPLA
jgi:hypothetical protein